MGRRLVALAATDPAFAMCAAVDWPQHPRLGEDAGVGGDGAQNFGGGVGGEGGGVLEVEGRGHQVEL